MHEHCESLFEYKKQVIDTTANCSPDRERSRAQRGYFGVFLGYHAAQLAAVVLWEMNSSKRVSFEDALWSWNQNFAKLIYVYLTVTMKLHLKL